MTTYSNVSLCFRSGVLPISCLAWWLWPFVHLSICGESHNLSSLLGMSLLIEVDLVGIVSLLSFFLNKTWFCVTKPTASKRWPRQLWLRQKSNQSNCIYDAHEDSDICMHAVLVNFKFLSRDIFEALPRNTHYGSQFCKNHLMSACETLVNLC